MSTLDVVTDLSLTPVTDLSLTPVQLGIGVATGRFTVAEAAALMPKEPEDLEPEVIDLTKAVNSVEPIDVTGVVENGKITELNAHLQNLVDAGENMAKELTEVKAENSKLKRLLGDFLDRSDFTSDEGDSLIFNYEKERHYNKAFEAVEELYAIRKELFIRNNYQAKRPKVEE